MKMRLLLLLVVLPFALHAEFQAGAVITDVTPKTLPVIANGGMVSRLVDKIKTPLKARALALSDDDERLVIVVVDSCMMPRSLLDSVKRNAADSWGIAPDRILISATHTHSAGSCMGALGTSADENYVPQLRDQLVASIGAALAALQPAQVAYGSTQAPEFTALRRWIRRPDRIARDPFGNPSVRANMHAARNLDDVTGESGPEDPELAFISLQTRAGEPLAMLANFSMHYFSGEQGISADYFGLFADGLKARLGPETDFVGIMSHGCSGDIWRRDYADSASQKQLTKIDEYAAGLVDRVVATMSALNYRQDVDLAMSEQRMTLPYRVPNAQLLEWSQGVVAEMGDRLPKSKEEIYAREQLFLHEGQETEVVTQALRIGDIAIATTPNETYAITGLKIKAASPLAQTMVIELANGGDGYIPPPEQHQLGGYNTWAARSAGLEVLAERKISESCINLLEQVCDKPRRLPIPSHGPSAQAIAQLSPQAWYRLHEFAGPRAVDASGNHRDAIYEPGVAFYLEGPPRFCAGSEANRAAMFAGGRLRVRPILRQQWTVSLWLWNGMPNDARDVTGWFLSRGHDHGLSPAGLHLGIGGNDGHSGQLVMQTGATRIAGTQVIPRWTWTQVALVCDGKALRVYLNGKEELRAEFASADFPQLFVGGRSDNTANWEGRLDEIAIFGRALSETELLQLAR